MKFLKPDSLIVLGIIAALTVAAVVTVFLPQSRELEDLRDEIASRKHFQVSNFASGLP